MSIENVRAYLAQFGADSRIIELSESSATVPLAAAALGVEEARIAKTLSFMVDGHATLVVFAGDARINNSAFKAQFHTKAKMLTPEQAVELVGHALVAFAPLRLRTVARFGWMSHSSALIRSSPLVVALTRLLSLRQPSLRSTHTPWAG